MNLMKKKDTLIINLIGGPGSGKSTTAAGLFHQLKQMGIDCEMALEFAKDKVWEESLMTLNDQIYIFGKQYHKLWRLNNKVDVIITDSPLLVSLYYNKEESKYFNDFVVEQYNKFNNVLYFINRPDDYQTNGRTQTEEESKNIDKVLKNLITKYNISYKEIDCYKAVEEIVKDIKNVY